MLVDGFRDLNGDLVAFQEALVTADYDQPAELLGAGFQFAHQKSRASDGSGCSIASRWPITSLREVDLHVTPRTADFPCVTLIAEVEIPPPIGTVLFVNHLPNWQLDFEYERELQTVVAAREIERCMRGRDMHVVMAGDLDADPRAASIRFWTGRQSLDGMSVCYRDAWESVHAVEPGHTFTPRNPLHADWDWPFRRIDYVFVRCGEHGGPTLQITDSRLLFNEPVGGVWASDHFGVVADLRTPAGARE